MDPRLLTFPQNPSPNPYRAAGQGWFANRPYASGPSLIPICAQWTIFMEGPIAIAKRFFGYGMPNNPPAPFKNRGNYKELLLKSPFEKGGFRGI
jgi:hypothetical protein